MAAVEAKQTYGFYAIGTDGCFYVKGRRIDTPMKFDRIVNGFLIDTNERLYDTRGTS